MHSKRIVLEGQSYMFTLKKSVYRHFGYYGPVTSFNQGFSPYTAIRKAQRVGAQFPFFSAESGDRPDIGLVSMHIVYIVTAARRQSLCLPRV